MFNQIEDILNKILQESVTKNASDVHLEPCFDQSLTVRYRINGELLKTTIIPPQFKDPIIARIKLLSNLDIAEKRLPQDGKLNIKLSSSNENQTLQFRVSTVNYSNGEKVVLRVINKKNNFQLSNLGLSNFQLTQLTQHLNQPQSLILITGATGSGKSVTLYSCLQYLKNSNKNIITVEDPIEMTIDGINQIAVNEKIGLSFNSILKHLLRQDPDIIMIGEIRDFTSAQIAVNAAQTGHLILTTLHSNNNFSAITRLLNLGVANYNLVESLALIINQKLIKTLCQNCKISTPLSSTQIKTINGINAINKSITADYEYNYIANTNGCQYCHQGYNNRVAIFKFLTIDNNIKSIIMNNNFSTQSFKFITPDNYYYQQLISLIQQGLIDFDSFINYYRA